MEMLFILVVIVGFFVLPVTFLLLVAGGLFYGIFRALGGGKRGATSSPALLGRVEAGKVASPAGLDAGLLHRTRVWRSGRASRLKSRSSIQTIRCQNKIA